MTIFSVYILVDLGGAVADWSLRFRCVKPKTALRRARKAAMKAYPDAVEWSYRIFDEQPA